MKKEEELCVGADVDMFMAIALPALGVSAACPEGTLAQAR
jgi:hypothetical protein